MNDSNKKKLSECFMDELKNTTNGSKRNSFFKFFFFPIYRLIYDIKEIIKTLNTIVEFLYLVLKKLRSKGSVKEIEESKLTKWSIKYFGESFILLCINNIPFIIIAYMIHTMRLPIIIKTIFIFVGVIFLISNFLILKRFFK